MYERVFGAIDALTMRSTDAIEKYDLERLGELMNVCHGLLNALGVSSWPLEQMVQIAREYGALGAKLTGRGQRRLDDPLPHGDGRRQALDPVNDFQVLV